MTRRAIPTPARGQVVEIDAMDVAEWESGQRTPQASDANLAELVRKSAATPPAASPVSPAHAQTVPRERARTQMGTPTIPRPPNRARTEPPGPPPKPATDGTRLPRAQTSSGSSAASARARVPDIPVTRPSEPEPRPSPAPMTSKGIDFSLPVTATSAGAPADAATPPPGPAFSMPVVEAGARPPSDPPRLRTQPRPASEPPRSQPRPGSEPPRSQPRPGSEPPRTATATSESGARPPQFDPPPAIAPVPAPLASFGSPFAEPSRVGPGHNAAPAGHIEPNTAWPPRPIPVDPHGPGQPPAGGRISSFSTNAPTVQLRAPARVVAPGPSPSAPPPARDDAAGAERLQVGLSRRRLWWIGGGIAAVSAGAIVAALMIPNPEAAPAGASDAAATQTAAQTSAPRRDPRPAPPVDRAAEDLRERVRLAREAAAAGVPMTAPVETDPGERRPASVDGARKPAIRKLVVDYSARPNEPAPPSLVAQSEEDPAIGKARTAYSTGNQRLFGGDVPGAIRAYHEALEFYPGYVGGFRGLGLAYEELGDTTNALTALRAYVAAVPNARDIVLIKKRIAHLQHH